MVVNQKSYIFMILFRLTTANITVYSLKTTIHISLINSYVDFYIAFFWRILASATAAKPPRHVPVNKLMECRFCFCKIVTECKACEPPIIQEVLRTRTLLERLSIFSIEAGESELVLRTVLQCIKLPV